ncbi:hypothetical protein [Aquimarina algiphila]|uniref:hypothetical protein n=1 Tax=Aquimarina algiphila TaxID=2047982 RepID=UPI00232B3FC3|nr:hypothetical protein [Aquimarina algiphila]
MRRILLQEHIIVTKKVFDEYFNDALQKGELRVGNEKGEVLIKFLRLKYFCPDKLP